MLLFNNALHICINLRSSVRRTGQGSISAQIFVLHCFHRNHSEIVTHAKTCDHSPRQFCGFFNIIAGT